jgi:hypothetical protein
VIDNISKQLKSLRKRPKELFITFLSRYHGILHDTYEDLELLKR